MRKHMLDRKAYCKFSANHYAILAPFHTLATILIQKADQALFCESYQGFVVSLFC